MLGISNLQNGGCGDPSWDDVEPGWEVAMLLQRGFRLAFSVLSYVCAGGRRREALTFTWRAGLRVDRAWHCNPPLRPVCAHVLSAKAGLRVPVSIMIVSVPAGAVEAALPAPRVEFPMVHLRMRVRDL